MCHERHCLRMKNAIILMPKTSPWMLTRTQTHIHTHTHTFTRTHKHTHRPAQTPKSNATWLSVCDWTHKLQIKYFRFMNSSTIGMRHTTNATRLPFYDLTPPWLWIDPPCVSWLLWILKQLICTMRLFENKVGKSSAQVSHGFWAPAESINL